MEFSARIKKEAKHYGVDPSWLVMADLRSIGYTDAEAYDLTHQSRGLLSASSLAKSRSDIVNSLDFKNLLSDRRRLLSQGKALAVEDIDLINNEQVAKEVLKAALSQPENSKERADLLIKYTDLINKNSEIGTGSIDDNGVCIYMPLKCYQCVLLEEYLDKQKKLEAKEEKAKAESSGESESDGEPNKEEASEESDDGKEE